VTEAGPAAELISHRSGDQLAGESVQFEWRPVEGASAYRLQIGREPGQADIYERELADRTKTAVNTLPTDGTPIYLRLSTKQNGAWQDRDYALTSFVAAYDESSIVVLEGIEHVRKRPSMYIGDTGIRGLHHLVYEIVDNSIDEAMAGVCDRISVVLRADGSVSVEDNGRGIPVGVRPDQGGLSALEICLTKLNAGGKFDRSSYKVSGGLHGVGVSVVNGLAKWLKVRVQREKKIWTMAFERGRTAQPLTHVGATERTGTLIDFMPDGEIFSETEFHYDILVKRLRELAYLNSGITISITDERNDQAEVFHFSEGIKEFVQHLNAGRTGLHETILFAREDEETRLICEVALQYTDGFNEMVLSFANNINTVEGGTHLSGFRAALTRVLNYHARKNGLYRSNDPTPSGDDIREGLTAVISVKVPEPQFEGQTKTKLGNGEVGTFVETTVNEHLAAYLEEHPSEAKRVIQKAVQAAQAREAARKARETARKSAMAGGGLSRKLVDCSSRDVESTELFIVEGDSAAGSAKGHRDSRTQAILPIRGKILNVEKARLHRILGHNEIIEIIKALGTGIGKEEFDLSKLRYGKIIIMTDADVDGSHIRTLLLTFFFRHLRPLIEHGKVFIAQPPLYQLQKGKKVDYLIDDPALHRRLTELGLENIRVEIKRPDGSLRRELTDEGLSALLRVIARIEHYARVLGRRGILFEPFVQAYYRDGKLPILRALLVDAEHYFYDEASFETFREQQEAAGVSFVKNELTETGPLAEAFASLGQFDCTVDDLFHRREELVTGELSPPLFVMHSKQKSNVEIENLFGVPIAVRSTGGQGWEVRRFKGLGEMNKEELWETTMNPENRVLRRVIVGETTDDPEQADIDAVEADRIFSILMGENVEQRREFIEINAVHVKNLDV
jgi:DNA gyrase subunit B